MVRRVEAGGKGLQAVIQALRLCLCTDMATAILDGKATSPRMEGCCEKVAAEGAGSAVRGGGMTWQGACVIYEDVCAACDESVKGGSNDGTLDLLPTDGQKVVCLSCLCFQIEEEEGSEP
jgi:hypothetical protein